MFSAERAIREEDSGRNSTQRNYAEATFGWNLPLSKREAHLYFGDSKEPKEYSFLYSEI